MEELLIALIQFVIEVLAQSLISLPFDYCTTRDGPMSRATVATLALIGGALVGGVSVALVPFSMLQSSWLRVASLLGSPLVAGWLGHRIATRRADRGDAVEPVDHFWYAFAFTFGLAAVRFAYAHHPTA